MILTQIHSLRQLCGPGQELSFLGRSQPSSPAASKRRKVQDPLTGLLDSIGAGVTVPVQVARLQVLLFLIDRHWKTIKPRAHLVLETVHAALSWDDPSVQSWALLCLAAIATEDRACSSSAADPSSPPSSSAVPSHVVRSPFASPSRKRTRSSDDNSLWDRAWTFAVRRAIVPAVCRAACHAAHAIMLADKVVPLTILTDVESLVRDIEIQGPSFPYDSVCDFLATAVEMASRDVRLFRMDLEAKVVHWLSTTWRVLDGTTKGFNVRTRLENHTPTDMLRLLSSLCRFPRHVILSQSVPLPDSPVIAHVVREAESAVVRDYIVHARLDLPISESPISTLPPTTPSSLPLGTAPGPNDHLVQLDGSARKLSTFLALSSDSLTAEWTDVDLEAAVTPEKIRRSTDLVVLVLAFEAVLELNGVSPERKAIKAACALLAAIAPSFALDRLSAAELAVMVQGLEPLVTGLDGSPPRTPAGSCALVSPGVMTGIRRDMLPARKGRHHPSRERERSDLLAILHIIWRSSDVGPCQSAWSHLRFSNAH